jgi:peroxiredoxin
MENDRRMNKLPLLWVGILTLLGIGVIVVYGMGFAGALTRGSNQTLEHVKAGEQAPDFELASLSGETIRLSDLRGKPVLVNFWATWCAPCVLEMPNFQKYYENYPGSFEILAVNSGETQEKVAKFVEDMGLTFPIVLDPALKVYALYRFQGYPTSYVIDEEGVIRFRQIGMMDEATLESYLTQLGALP